MLLNKNLNQPLGFFVVLEYFMHIIPVLDLKNGLVVHAKQGNREHYQSICSKLCPSADIFAVIEAFLSLADFTAFYIADLDAITGRGHHDALIADVMNAFPTLQFWVDKGYQQAANLPLADNYWPVLGSESFDDASINELGQFAQRYILSLDYLANGKLGATRLFDEPSLWPQCIIIMTLAQVGSGKGPDLAKLRHYVQTYPGYDFIAAGGIRNMDDLNILSNLGIKHALLASTLHSGAIGKAELEYFRQKNTPAS